MLPRGILSYNVTLIFLHSSWQHYSTWSLPLF